MIWFLIVVHAALVFVFGMMLAGSVLLYRRNEEVDPAAVVHLAAALAVCWLTAWLLYQIATGGR